MRYVYRGDAFTDPVLRGAACDPVRRTYKPDGKCITGGTLATQLVRFADGRLAVVLRRQLRVVERDGV